MCMNASYHEHTRLQLETLPGALLQEGQSHVANKEGSEA